MLHLQVPPVVLINAAPASTTVAGHDSYYTLHTRQWQTRLCSYYIS